MKRLVIAVTGPAGAGKSAVAIRLARQINNCAHIDADTVKHMIENGFSKQIKSNGDALWHYSEWGLVGDAIGMLAKLFLGTEHSVIINGYLDVISWQRIDKHVRIDHKILLLPDIATLKYRDALREKGYQMGEAMVTEHHNHFTNSPFFKDFIKIDSTKHKVDETVGQILKLVT